MRVIIYGANIEFMRSYNRAWYQLMIYFFIKVFIWENELRSIENEARIYINDMATCKAAHATCNDAVKALIELVTQIVSSGRKGGCQQGDLPEPPPKKVPTR